MKRRLEFKIGDGFAFDSYLHYERIYADGKTKE